jgi:hypothetical protein
MLISWLAQPYAIQKWVSDLFVEDSLFVDPYAESSFNLFVNHCHAELGATRSCGGQTTVGGPQFRSSDAKKHDIISEQRHPCASSRTGKSALPHPLVSTDNHPTLGGNKTGRSGGRPF